MDLDKLLEGALKVGASDIHLMEDAPPYLRVDGTIVPVRSPAISHDELLAIL